MAETQEQKTEVAQETKTDHNKKMVSVIGLLAVCLVVSLVIVGFMRSYDEPEKPEQVTERTTGEQGGPTPAQFAERIAAARRAAQTETTNTEVARTSTTREQASSDWDREEASYARKARRGEMILLMGLTEETEQTPPESESGLKTVSVSDGAPSVNPTDELRRRLEAITSRSERIRRIDGEPN